MDLASAVSGFQQATTLGAVQLRVAKLALDDEQAQGDAAVKLIQAANVGVNKAGDSLTAAATGLGRQVDTHA